MPAVLDDPHEGPVRVAKECAESTRVQELTLDEPGWRDIRTLYREVVA